MLDKKEVFNDLVLGRRSVKRYDPTVKISTEELENILKDATRAPSSINMQPWRLLVINSEEGKEKLLPLSPSNSDQITTSSAVIAIFADLMWGEKTQEIFDQSVLEGNMPADIAQKMIGIIDSFTSNLSEEDKKFVVTLDCGLFAQQLMITARAYGYDTCPIGGYDKDSINEVFGWDKRYMPVLLVSIGKVKDPGKPSSRLPLKSIAEWV